MLTWFQKQRLAYIGARLKALGTVSRRDLQRYFDITSPTAGDDFERFVEAFPGACVWSAEHKAFVPTDKLASYELPPFDYPLEVPDHVKT